MVREGPVSPAQLVRATAAMIAFGLASAGCSSFLGTTAGSFMRHIRTSEDPNLRYSAYGKLADPGCYTSEEQKDEAVKLLAAALEPGREPTATRVMICRTLGELGRPEAREALIKATDDPDALIRSEACRALGKVGTQADVAVLSRVMTLDRQSDCRIAAIDGLGELNTSDLRTQSLLVENMDHLDPAVRLASLRALRKLTGKDLGIETGAWRAYVAERAAAEATESGQGPRGAGPGNVPARDSETRRVATSPPPLP
jgi:hypothetical protein